MARDSFLSRWWHSDVLWSWRRSPVAIVSTFVLLILVFAAMLAPLVAPYTPFDPSSLNLMDGFTAPGEKGLGSGNTFWLGTDDQGRDIYSAILYGMRLSLFIGVMAVALAAFLGISLGLIAGYCGGWIDAIIMRIADIQLTFPSILVALFAMVESRKEYIQAARLIGRSPTTIIRKHLLPNVMSPVLVIATISLALAIILEATLSFLGVGAPPTKPSLGTLIRIGQDFLFAGEWWIILFPSLTFCAKP